ncbi:MAG: fumarylacetoacetate hydrolase family protein [Candidatus Xenobia bacterium]
MRLATLLSGALAAADAEGRFIPLLAAHQWLWSQGLVRSASPPADMLEFLRAGDPARDAVQTILDRSASLPAWMRVAEIQPAAPLPRPGKILAVGLNYAEHIDEQKAERPEMPVIFTKFPSSVIGYDMPVVRPGLTSQLDYEAELGLVIGRRASRVAEDEAAAYIAGYTVINDVTARDLQKTDRQWVRAKSMDTFCPMGPVLVTRDEIPFPPVLNIRLWVNGELRQDASTTQMLHGPARIVSWLSEAFTLEPGDCIATGTPAGVGAHRKPPVFLQSGDMVEIEVEHIGRLRNPIQ